MPVRIVADSNCDLPAEAIAQHGIHVVPSLINFAGRSYRDGVDLSRRDYYERLPGLRPLPTTAAPSAGEFEAAFRAGGGQPVVCLVLAGRLSAIFNAARLAAEAVAADGIAVSLVDSGQVSMGFGWQVLAAAEAIAAGGTADEAAAAARGLQPRVRLFAVLDTVEYLRRGGRANAIAATLGELLQVKPLLEVRDGEVVVLARQRTRAKARADLIARTEALGRLERLAVMHADSEAGAAEVAARLGPLAQHPLVTGEITATIGTHAGPGTIGIAAVCAA